MPLHPTRLLSVAAALLFSLGATWAASKPATTARKSVAATEDPRGARVIVQFKADSALLRAQVQKV